MLSLLNRLANSRIAHRIILTIDGLHLNVNKRETENSDPLIILLNIYTYLNSSNTDGSFIMANSNSFLSPYEILPIAQENKYSGKFSYFIMKLYVLCTRGDSNEYIQHTIIV